MTIFSRYVFRQTSGALLLVLLSLTGIVWISLALRELNVVTSQGQGALTLIKMTTLGLPSFVAVITPFALLITAIHTLNRLNSDSEIIVLTASGATAWTITKPLVALGLIVVVFISFVNHYAMPWSLRLLRDIVVEVRTDLLTQVIQPGRFSSPETGLTFHIRERAADGTLRGLVMHDLRDEKQAQSYLADKGVLVKDDSGAYLFMMDGHILRRSGGITVPTQIIAFDKYAVDLDRLEERTAGPPDFKARERYFSELVSPDPKEKSYKTELGRYRSELHERFSGALYPLAFVLMAIAVVGQAQSTRQNRNMRMGLCFLAGVGIRLTGLAVNNVVTLHASAVPLLYLIPLSAIGISMFLIVRGARARKPNPRIERLMDAAGALAAGLKQRFSRAAPAAAGRAGG
ncbi:LPS export ABC transporter permease LptF [uncultured Hyphomicrobium sp.]|jgi:lipopolysaccharide export system permease protein|uniref:LPS export ABC transporter permease LptF n=1 Tax=uncultured Hyphomicrobium sp. TaxID=194373 RepID=UPI0025F6CA3F|nr:LPS export ABC transporter permease LptF [uncultured Hyphomicrobium sp.]